MANSNFLVSFWRAAFVAGFGVALVAGSIGVARAGDDDQPGETFDTKIMRDVLHGIGLRDGTEKSIDYHERSPLVVPPSRDLPPPATRASAADDPAWPNDKDSPTSAKRKKQAKKDLTAVWSEGDRNPVLTPQEMEVGRGTSRDVNGPGRQSDTLSPQELGYKGGLFSLDNILGKNSAEPQQKFSGEPARSSLLEPPPGYRTPAANQPYGASREKIAPRSAEDIFETSIGNR